MKAEILQGSPEVSAKNFGALSTAESCIPAVYCPHVGLLESFVFPEWISSIFAGKIRACQFLSVRIPRIAFPESPTWGNRPWDSRAMLDSALLTHPLTDRGCPQDFGAPGARDGVHPIPRGCPQRSLGMFGARADMGPELEYASRQKARVCPDHSWQPRGVSDQPLSNPEGL